MKMPLKSSMISVRVDFKTAQALNNIASQRGITITEAARSILAEAVSGGVVNLKSELEDLKGRLSDIEKHIKPRKPNPAEREDNKGQIPW